MHKHISPTKLSSRFAVFRGKGVWEVGLSRAAVKKVAEGFVT